MEQSSDYYQIPGVIKYQTNKCSAKWSLRFTVPQHQKNETFTHFKWNIPTNVPPQAKPNSVGKDTCQLHYSKTSQLTSENPDSQTYNMQITNVVSRTEGQTRVVHPKMTHTKTQTTKKLGSHRQIIREDESEIPLPLPEVSRVAQLSRENRPKMARFLQRKQPEWSGQNSQLVQA